MGTKADDAAGADGRALRSARSREKILAALIELVAEGDLQPTGERVAARAGCGLRTVYRHFEDMDGLMREMQAYVKSVALPIAAAEPAVDGTLEERLSSALRRRIGVFERVAPFVRSGASVRWRSEFLQESHAEMGRTLRADLLRCVPEAAAHAEIAELLTSFEAWDRLRVDQKLGRERAQAVLERSLLVLLRTSVRRASRRS